MSEQEIFNKLIEIMKQLFEGSKVIDYLKITLDSKPVDNLGFNSIDLIVTSFAIEKEFKIDISNLTAESFKTVKDVVNYIKERVSVH